MKQYNFQVTIPVLNEEKRLEKGIRETFTFFQQNKKKNWYVEIADNGSTDRTEEIAQSLVQEYKPYLTYRKIPQKGVGLAIRHSWQGSNKDIVGYMDVDLATDLKHLLEVESVFQNKQAEIVNGSRLLPGATVEGRTLIREITSRALNGILHVLLKVQFSDAMIGFKFFQRKIALELLEETPVIPDWFVSAELLIRAEWKGYKIYEIPVHWVDEPNSKVNIPKLAKQYLGHIQRLKKEKNELCKDHTV